MIVPLILILLVFRADGTLPDLGVRVSVWFIGMFLLTVGAALLYLRIGEFNEMRREQSSPQQ